MGLFSKLADSLKQGAADLKQGAAELKQDETFKKLGQAAEQAASKVSKLASDSLTGQRPQQQTAPRAQQPAVSEPAPSAEPVVYDTGEEYFDTIVLDEKFPGYTIERGVHPRVMDSGAHPSCIPIAYLFSRGGRPVLAVLLMKPNQTRAMIARGTYGILDANRIPYIRFLKGYPNEEAYVIDRIKKNLP